MDSQICDVTDGVGDDRISGEGARSFLLFAIPSLVPTEALSCFYAFFWGTFNRLMATEAVKLASGTDW